MSDKLGGNFSVETYIAKHESLLLDHVRRLLQAETKNVLLESGLQEMYKKNEELTEQLNIQKTTSDQSINGLQAITLERDKLQTKLKEQEQSYLTKIKEVQNALDDCNNQTTGLRGQYNSSTNRTMVLEGEIQQLNTKLQVANNDYATLKENYNKVLEALEEANRKLDGADKKLESVEVVKTTKPLPKKKKTADSEWVDGEYKVST